MTSICNTPRLIIGVDPGKMTGLAWLIDDTFKSTDLTAINACDMISNLLISYSEQRPVIIAAERYNITQRTVKLTRQYDALEVIGTCRWMAHNHHTMFILQAASEAQRCGNRDVLRALGWWKPGGDHLNKAAAQVVLAYQQAFPHEFARRLEPGMIS
jgi:predicted RNase H-like nuclease (RuvC/YqgF family)